MSFALLHQYDFKADSSSEEVHFLQIWAKPNEYGLKPKYYTR